MLLIAQLVLCHCCALCVRGSHQPSTPNMSGSAWINVYADWHWGHDALQMKQQKPYGVDLQYAAGMTEVEFQLAHCGHLLQRDAPPDRDPRAKSFNPDYWQVTAAVLP